MEFRILNNNFIGVGLVEIFESMIWIENYQTVGNFELVVLNNLANRSMLVEGNYIIAPYSDNVMIIESINRISDIETGDKLLITGRSLESILERRIIWNQTVLDTTLHTGLKQLINENITGSAIITARRISNFIFEDSLDSELLGITLKGQYHGDNLYEVIKTECNANGIGFKVRYDSFSNNFIFNLYKGVVRDHSQTARPYITFSFKNDNLLSTQKYYSILPFKNVSLVGGEGEGYNRIMETVSIGAGPAISGMYRRETFTDASYISSTINGGTLTDAQYRAILDVVGLDDLYNKRPLHMFDAKINEINSYRYSIDYFLGDKVQMVNEEEQTSDSVTITSVTRASNYNGDHTYLSFDK